MINEWNVQTMNIGREKRCVIFRGVLDVIGAELNPLTAKAVSYMACALYTNSDRWSRSFRHVGWQRNGKSVQQNTSNVWLVVKLFSLCAFSVPLICFALRWFNFRCFALLCSALLCFALLCFALLCSTLFACSSFALLFLFVCSSFARRLLFVCSSFPLCFLFV